MARTKKPEALTRTLRWFEQDKASHDTYMAKVEKRYKAYRAIVEIRSDAAAWTSKQHPAYVLQIIETMVANLLDPNPRWRIKARPRFTDPAQWAEIQKGAKTLELLLSAQVDADHLAEKQTVFAKQALIAGMSVYKTFWDFQERSRRRQTVQHQMLLDDQEQPIAMVPMLGVSENVETVRDDPTAEVVDVRDFIWHEAAVSLDKAQRVHHRIWMSYDELKRLEKQGIYSNADKLKESKNFSEGDDREEDLFQVNRSKDMVEVVETWWRKDDGSIGVTTIGNRNVLLRDRDNPFWHGEYPFIVCSSMPDLFRIPGISTVEIAADLQEMLWTLLNARLDNVRLLNNVIVLLRSDVYDTDAFEWYPGAQWLVDDPNQVKTLEVSPLPAQISIEAEALIKGDIQNVTGGMPFMSGTQNQQNDQQTATGVSIVTSLAQRRMSAHKQQFKWCYKRLGEQWISLDQQFITERRLVETIGPGAVNALQEVLPEQFAPHDYYIDVEQMDEAMMRSQRTAEAQAKLQVALSGVQVQAALAQQGMARMLNMDEFWKDFLEAYGHVTDVERYFVSQSPTQIPQAAGSGAPPSSGSAPGGVTSPLATDGNSPSSALSQSPVAAMQRQGALQGGPVNTPNG